MSKACRDLLLGLWQDQVNNNHMRAQAFSLWAATRDPDDIEILRVANTTDGLADRILGARLIRGDQEAIPTMIEKLAGGSQYYGWQFGRYFWSPTLTDALDEHWKNGTPR